MAGVDELAPELHGPSRRHQVRGRAHPAPQAGLSRADDRPEAGLLEREGCVQPGDSSPDDGDPGGRAGWPARSRRGWPSGEGFEARSRQGGLAEEEAPARSSPVQLHGHRDQLVHRR
jgi:hypothetical protein